MDSLFVVENSKDGKDNNILKNLGTMLVALIGILILILIAIALGLLVKKYEK
jgi:lipopolysaccharide/colanic/teichoic acid biosynthesis glycosyltransferase